MALSLQEQLLKAGLVDEKKAKQADKEKRKVAKQKRAKGKKSAQQEKAEAMAAMRAVRAEQKRQDRALSLDQQRDREQKAKLAQIRQMVEQHQVARAEGDLGYQFTDGKKIKKLMLNREQHAQVVNGQLAVVRAPQGYALVKPEIGRKIAERDASQLVVLNESQAENAGESDDPYAEFQVPDDLMW